MKYLPLILLFAVIACSRADDNESITRSIIADSTQSGNITIMADTAWKYDTIIHF